MRIVTLAAATAAVLALAAPASAALRYTTVAQHAGHPPRASSSEHAAHVLVRKADVARITDSLRPGDASRVGRVDLRRYVLIAALTWIPDPCYHFRITRLERKAGTLVVRALRSVDRDENRGCIQVIGSAYQVVKVRRSAFGGRVPARAVLRAETLGRGAG